MAQIMSGIPSGILALLLSAAGAAVEDKGQSKSATPAEQYKALMKEFYEQTHVFSFTAKTDEERANAVARVDTLRVRCLELAEKHPKDAIAIAALTQAITLFEPRGRLTCRLLDDLVVSASPPC